MKSEKKLDNWNIEKKKICNNKQKIIFPRERQIWYVKMWVNIWFEQDWKKEFLRPFLIIKKIWSLYFWIAMSSIFKESFFYQKLKTATFVNEKYFKENSMIMISQWKIFDIKRFEEKIWYISEKEFIEIKEKLKNIYF